MSFISLFIKKSLIAPPTIHISALIPEAKLKIILTFGSFKKKISNSECIIKKPLSYYLENFPSNTFPFLIEGGL